MSRAVPIAVRGASEHNLRAIDLDLPREALIVVTGVSGSGKSSLVFDTICREAQRRYLESFSSYARQFLGRLSRPALSRIEGLSPAVAVTQRPPAQTARSTVGTLCELYDYLRLLFARAGTPPSGVDRSSLSRSLFSFNSPVGACPRCGGLGIEDRIDPDLLVADPARTLREGALVPTTPSGYIVYSQVTVDALDQVCRAHGFSVDVPWRELTAEQREVVLRGSDRVRIPFGKHTLESRLRWSGITAKPRPEGVYLGLLPVMEQALERNRNRNILRFVRSMRCSSCAGARLRPEALAVTFQGRTIAELASLSLLELKGFAANWRRGSDDRPGSGARVAATESLLSEIRRRAELLCRLGLGYLALDRDATSLAGGELQRLRLGTQALAGLRGLLYIFDEPSSGLHARDTERLLELLRALRDGGNTVIVVEHDPRIIRAADFLVDLGPGAGEAGGELLFAGPAAALAAADGASAPRSLTRAFLTGAERLPEPARRAGRGPLRLQGIRRNNLRGVDVELLLGAFNAISGVSGAGKSSLVEELVARFESRQLEPSGGLPSRLVHVDAAPIGRTPRSNPATYTGLSDAIRDLYAASPEARARGFGKGRFSFNVRGGRCEACEGAGSQQLGMHFLGSVDVTCSACGGRRFNDATLEVRWRDKDIHEVLELSIDDACRFFEGESRLERMLTTLCSLGLGYLKLGQPSTTLSGGEAQRIKLAAELGRPQAGRTLYLLDEPTTGLHVADVRVLLAAIARLVDAGNTVVAIEHDLDFLRAADWIVDLGPEGGASGGRVVAMGPPERIAACSESRTGAALRAEVTLGKSETASRGAGIEALPLARSARGAQPTQPRQDEAPPLPAASEPAPIRLSGVRTHNLRGFDVEFPANRLTVLTGVSGSGKSSLAFDTLVAEARNRFTDCLSTWARRFAGVAERGRLESCSGLTPTVALAQASPSRNPRSTVGTMTDAWDLLRLLFARAGVSMCPTCHTATEAGRCRACGWTATRPLPSSLFSFNDDRGACPDCSGLGRVRACDPGRLVTDPSRSLLAGAMDGHKTGRFYGDPHGQYTALLRAVGTAMGIDFGRPFSSLDDEARRIALFGTGERVWEAEWEFEPGAREASRLFRAQWLGLARYVDAEYQRKHADHRADALEPLMAERRCASCDGERLSPEPRAVVCAGRRLGEVARTSVSDVLAWLTRLDEDGLAPEWQTATADLRAQLARRLRHLVDAGVGYLALERAASTLSAGEAQRVRLAAGLAAGLTGITYVLDEPSRGLHARDTDRLLRALQSLRDAGNTVIVVEHDEQFLAAADHVVELGPGAGAQGGCLTAAGSPATLRTDAGSRTGRLLRGDDGLPARAPRKTSPGVVVRGACANNLREVDVSIPSGALVGVAGVSGSGKSTLVFEVLGASLSAGQPVGCRAIDGLERFTRVSALRGRGGTGGAGAMTATALGVFDRVRDVFAATAAAKAGAWRARDFSLQAKGGRCESCEGTGELRVAMDFLPDVHATCDACGGSRYRPELLECTVNGKSIAGVLELTAAEAAEFFASDPVLERAFNAMQPLGLGYLRLGQRLSTLSGGELQRLELVAGLFGLDKGPTLYLLDEPSAGLAADDVALLVATLHALVDGGSTVIAVEHHLGLLAACDHLIELGPEAGPAGGRVVATGSPEQLARAQTATAQALRDKRIRASRPA